MCLSDLIYLEAVICFLFIPYFISVKMKEATFKEASFIENNVSILIYGGRNS